MDRMTAWRRALRTSGSAPWPLAAAIVLGILVRLYVAKALDGKAFNDTAIVGLMEKKTRMFLFLQR